MMTVKRNWMRDKILRSKAHQYESFNTVNGLSVINREGKNITLDNGKKMVEFISCSYLGLDQDKRLIQSTGYELDNFGLALHCARTRLQPQSSFELDDLLRQIYCGSYPVTFPSVHMVHQGFLPLIGSGEMPGFPLDIHGAYFIIDKTAHSSLQINIGILAQFGQVVRIDFKDSSALEIEFKKARLERMTPITISDSIGSMTSVAPVKLLINLASKYAGYVYLDDAHGTSIYGKNGCGYTLDVVDQEFDERLIIAASLGKGFGVTGGVLLLKNKQDADFVKCFSPAYVFSGPLSNPVINACIASAKIHLNHDIYQLQKKLFDNIRYFDDLMGQQDLSFYNPAPFRIIPIGSEDKTLAVSQQLKDEGILLTTAMYPTVEKGKGILRAAISASHTKEQIALLFDKLNQLCLINYLEEEQAVNY